MRKVFLSASIALVFTLLISSCKTTQLQTVQKLKSIPGSAADTTGWGTLIGNSIGGGTGGFGLTGAGQGGGGAGNVSGLGGIGTISPGLGYGSEKKKETTKTSPNRNEQKAQAKSAGSSNEKSNQSLVTSLASASSSGDDQEKVKRLDAFKQAPTQSSSSKVADTKREVIAGGFHPKEMPEGNYVAVESFMDEVQANRYAARLVNMGFDPNVPRYVSAEKRWYVCLEGPIRSSQITKRIDYYRSNEIFKSVWHLTIR